MLDMGFLPDIRRILRHLPGQAADAVLLGHHAAADRDPLPRDAARSRSPSTSSASPRRRSGSPRPSTRSPPSSSRRCSWSSLKRGEIRSVIVFTRTKHRANRLADYLVRHGVTAGRIHGNRSQSQRTQALAGFKAGKFPVLVATDIAARGIDVDALSHVVNFDVPAVAGRLHPPRGPHGPRRGHRRRVPLRGPRGGERPARHRARHRQAPAAGHRSPASTTRRSRPRSSRCRWPSGWRRCGHSVPPVRAPEARPPRGAAAPRACTARTRRTGRMRRAAPTPREGASAASRGS